MQRVVWIVLDSVGVGALPDAHAYADLGAATLQHTAQAAAGLSLPNLERLGLGNIVPIQGVPPAARPEASYGRMAERSAGKDTTTGHWEMAGLVVSEPFPVFPNGFPPEIVEPFVRATGRGVLGNKPASGTAIIDELGPAHLETGDWILYTSADSVFQLAAHEEKIPLGELYRACRIARGLLDPYRVGRVIARPFVGRPGAFARTYNRHDYSLAPIGPTVLSALAERGTPVHGVGKIRDIFAGVGVTEAHLTAGNAEGLQTTLRLLERIERGLVFTNLVDFDMLYGHRRDPAGYAAALLACDPWLGEIRDRLGPDDLLLITADHGCDPTFQAHTDHTREFVPLLAYARAAARPGVDLGTRETFADLAATVAEAFGVPFGGPGESFLGRLGIGG